MSDTQNPNTYPDTGPADQGSIPPAAGQSSSQSKPMPVWVLLFILIPIVFLVIGGINLYYDYDMVKRYVETDGKVLETRVDKHWSTSGSGRSRRRTRQYRPIIEYQYTVDGKTYHGDRYTRAKTSSSSRSYATNAVNKYPKGSTCKVYYDPDKPENSVLMKKLSTLFIIFTVVGGVLTILMGIGLPVQFIRSRMSLGDQHYDAGDGPQVGGAPY